MPHVQIQYPDGRQVQVRLAARESVIGRDATCEITLDDHITSRRHARLRCDDDGNYWIEDLHSKNGTTVNDEPALTPTRVLPGDRIGIGGCFLTLGDRTGMSVVLSEPEPGTVHAATSAWRAHERFILPKQRLEKLYALQERLAGRIDRDDLLGEVVDICVEQLRFDRAGVAVWRGPPHPPQWIRWKNLDAAGAGELRISRSLVDRALHDGERILLNDTAAEQFDPTASIISNNIRSAMCVPVPYQDAVRGVIYVDRVTSTGGYAREDIDFFAALGRMAGMALSNVQLLEEQTRRQQVELQIRWARQIQERLFPQEPLTRPGLCIDALNEPGQQVSGDYYDYFVRPDGLITLVMADVAGKGIPASLLMANLQAAVHVTLDVETDLAAAVNRLNDLVCRNVSDSRFITGVFGLLDPSNRTFTFVNAGHPPPYVVRPGRPLSTLTAETECPIGVEKDIEYKATVATLDAGPLTLFFYTDGIPDAENEAGDFFGEPRLAAFLTSNPNRPPNDLMTRLRAAIKQFTRGQAQTDDITILAARLD